MSLLQNDSLKSPPAPVTPPVPAPLLSSNPLQWLRIFGPGAVVASLTIGAGELIFSTRGGALFGFNILWLFLVTLLMKWVLAYSIARHMVIWGWHPFQRWSQGPLAPLPLIFFILAMLSFPIWTAFHAGTVGTLLTHLTGSGVGNVTHLAWGVLLLGVFGGIAFRGGYVLLEKIQVAVVLILLIAVAIVAFKLNPAWLEVLRGLFIPRELVYPAWISQYPEIANRTPALECITYVGILGGSSYDYLAYASYLRDKRWGNAATPQSSSPSMDRRWLRAPFIDCTMSFLAVLVFTVVFVICGVLILGTQGKVPSGGNLLTLQAEFVTPLFPQLKQLYFLGALLAMAGTLYGTIEVAPTLLREFILSTRRAMTPAVEPANMNKLRRFALLWVCGGGILVLLAMVAYAALSSGGNPPALLTVLTPANLFTGVLGCGIICLTTLLPEMKSGREWRLSRLLMGANLICGFAFLALGIRACWDHSGWASFAVLAATVGVGWIINKVWQRKF